MTRHLYNLQSTHLDKSNTGKLISPWTVIKEINCLTFGILRAWYIWAPKPSCWESLISLCFTHLLWTLDSPCSELSCSQLPSSQGPYPKPGTPDATELLPATKNSLRIDTSLNYLPGIRKLEKRNFEGSKCTLSKAVYSRAATSGPPASASVTWRSASPLAHVNKNLEILPCVSINSLLNKTFFFLFKYFLGNMKSGE